MIKHLNVTIILQKTDQVIFDFYEFFDKEHLFRLAAID